MIILSFGLPVIIFQPLLPALCSNFFSFFSVWFLLFPVLSCFLPQWLPAPASSIHLSFTFSFPDSLSISDFNLYLSLFWTHSPLQTAGCCAEVVSVSVKTVCVLTLTQVNSLHEGPAASWATLPAFLSEIDYVFFLSMAIQGSVEKLFEKVFFQKYFWNHILTSVFKIQQFTSLFLL